MPPKQSVVAKSVAKANAALCPFSRVVTPATVPPPVNRNPKRHLVVDLDVRTTTLEPLTLAVANVRDAIAAMTGSIPTDVYFLLEYVHVWGPVTNAGANSLYLTDKLYGTATSSDNTVTTRARAGVMYPKNVQKTFGPEILGSSALVSAQSSLSDADLTFRVGVTYWCSTSYTPMRIRTIPPKNGANPRF